jgi:indole-3-acetate monooxygenase
MLNPDAHPVVAAARALGPALRAAQPEMDAEGKLPAGLLQSMTKAGLFRLVTPAHLGGLDVDAVTMLSAVEEVAKGDGSAGWTVAVGNSGLLWGSLQPDAARTVFAAGPDVISAGSANPAMGRAVRVPGGYQVSGTWKFASACRHATWFTLNSLVTDGKDFIRNERGAVDTRVVVLPAEQVCILDTWHVVGLRGSGSNDVKVDDAFVPEAFAFGPDPSSARRGMPWDFPRSSWLGIGFAAVGLGLARSAIDCVVDLAGAKKPVGSPNLLRDRPNVQADVARAEIKLRAARGLLHQMVDTMWRDAEAGRVIGLEQRALLRGAAVNSAQVSAEVTDLMYATAGATSLYQTFPIERCWRDVHAMTQQIMVSPQFWEVTGRVLLGLDPGLLPF